MAAVNLTASRAVLRSLQRAQSTLAAVREAAASPPPDWPIYLDVQATSPMDPRVVDAMLPHMLHRYGNAHSSTHAYGWNARDAVEEAREHVAQLVNADAREIIFTSGATESNNIAIKGVVNFLRQTGKNHVVTLSTEHKCVLDSCRAMEQTGIRVTYLPVSAGGLITVEEVAAALTDQTCLVSIMAINNEIGVCQPIEQIGALCRSRGVLFHTDAAQAAGKVEVDVRKHNIDLMSLSGHKIYGPKGVGALYVRRRPRVRLEPQMSGGGQERGIRSGTLPVPLCVGFGEAARIACREREMDFDHVSELSQRLVQKIHSGIPNVIRNGDAAHSYPGCVNLSFAYVEGESLLMALKRVALSSGSACTSASLEPSYVLRALGTDEDLAHSSLRFGIGRFTTKAEVDFTAASLIKEVYRLRELSPLWEMVQEGIDLKSIQWSQH